MEANIISLIINPLNSKDKSVSDVTTLQSNIDALVLERWFVAFWAQQWPQPARVAAPQTFLISAMQYPSQQRPVRRLCRSQ